MNPQNSETISNPKFEAGKLHPDSAAAAAIKALPAGELAAKLVELEEKYEQWTGTTRGQLSQWVADPVLRILRSQVALLAQEIQPALLEAKAATGQQYFGKEYLRMTEDNRKLRAFLMEYFESEMRVAVSRDTPLLEVVKALLLKNR